VVEERREVIGRLSMVVAGGVLALVLSGCGTTGTARKATLRDEWIDATTGHRVVRLSLLPGESESFYFHQNAYTPEGDKMVFENTQPGASNRLFTLELATRRSEPLTGPGVRQGFVARGSRNIYYQRSNEVCVTHLDTKATRVVATLPRGWSVSTVNADETLLAGTFVEGGQKIQTRGRPKSEWFNAIYDSKQPQQLFSVEIATGKTNSFHRYEGWLGHVQFSPTDPTLLMFCHEGPWHQVDRIWQIRTDGSGLRLMHARSMPMEIAGHEFWSWDGQTAWFDLQTPRGEKFWLAGVELATGKATRYALERDQWSVHYNLSRDQKLFAGDGGGTNMVAKAKDGKWIWLFTPRADGNLRAEHLVDMSKHDYALEPNVNFTPDGKWIVLRGNFDGSPQVYAVEVAKDTGGVAQ
jgi:oligogalacturonide lyase